MIFFELAGYREQIRHLSEQLLAVPGEAQKAKPGASSARKVKAKRVAAKRRR